MMFFITATVAPVCIFFFIYLTVNTRNITYMHQEDICHVFGLGLVTIIYSTMATENIAGRKVSTNFKYSSGQHFKHRPVSVGTIYEPVCNHNNNTNILIC